MNRKLAIIIGLQTFLIVMLFWVLVFYGKDEYEASTKDTEKQIQVPNHVSSKHGQPVVITIDSATQAQSAIKTSILKASTHTASASSYGNVVSIDGLIDLRTRYLAAKAEAQVVGTILAHNKNEYARLQALNLDDKNISDKALASALADIKADEARVSAAEASAKSISDTMRQNWGGILTQLATNQDDNGLLQNLINHNEVLIQITLPFDAAEPAAKSRITVAPAASTATAVSAEYLSRAPLSNATIQGKTYFYHAKTTDLRAGMQVSIRGINSSSKQASGVIIPGSAVIWYGGNPWVYRKTDDDQFSRLPINTDIEIDNGWFYQGNLKPDNVVVTSGAQLLLSEEFKSQITNENED